MQYWLMVAVVTIAIVAVVLAVASIGDDEHAATPPQGDPSP